jgi:hypothetical protein
MIRAFYSGVHILLAILFAPAAMSQLQPDSAVDVFPLAVGNQWTYRYQTRSESWPAGQPYETLTDSGRVVYTVIGSVPGLDSTRWQFEVRRDLVRHDILYFPGIDTTYPVRDTSAVELVESHAGQHQLYRNADPYTTRLDVFPWTRNYIDSTMILRFREVGPGDTVAIRSWITAPPGSQFRSSFTFKKNVGLTRNSYHSGTMDVYSTNEHVLLGSVLASAPEAGIAHVQVSFVLLQNFPNPFNPSTTIRYNILSRSLVTLTVFDLLGREVATLVDGMQDPGEKTVTFDGSALASGVYFYRLKAGEFVQTRKLVLVR